MAALHKLTNGIRIPALGFGTWLSAKELVGESVKIAIETGYRHIDCASRYGNEDLVGDALRDVFRSNEIKRDELFIVSKLWAQDFNKVKDAFKRSLDDLKLDHFDMYMIHLPFEIDETCPTFFPENGVGLIGYNAERTLTVWRNLEELYKEGLTKSLGVCNYTTSKLSNLIKDCEIKPHCLQVELHPYLPQWKILEYCKREGIQVTGFSSLGSQERPYLNENDPILIKNPIIANIAERNNCSSAQVLLSWGLQRDTCLLTRSVHEDEIRDGFASTNVTLSEDDIEEINKIDTRCRYMQYGWGKKPDQTMEEHWDGEM